MNKSPLTKVLLGVLLVSALTSLGLCLGLFRYTRQLPVLQAQVQMANNNRALLSALAGEALEYSKRNPAIDPILEAAGIKGPKAGAPPVPPQAVKPAAK